MATVKYRNPMTGEFITLPSLMGPPGATIKSINQTNNTEPSAKNTITLITTDGKEASFDYYNGHGIKEVQQIETSTVSSGINKFRFIYSDSDTHYQDVQVMNGNGISNIQQDVTSSQSGGNNNVKITLSDGTVSNITIRNGIAGGIDEITSGPGYIEYISPNDGQTKQVSVGAPTRQQTDTSKIYVLGAVGENAETLQYNTNVYVENNVLMGAAWNDYAEFRDQLEKIEPGYIVYSEDDGKLRLTKERMQPFEGVVSDTYGFAIGATSTHQTPLAVSGRVLVYVNPEEEFHFGDCICAGPDGIGHRMSREEIIEYPDRIVGTVSEIPTYDTWGANNITINNRIWIKVR